MGGIDNISTWIRRRLSGGCFAAAGLIALLGAAPSLADTPTLETVETAVVQPERSVSTSPVERATRNASGRDTPSKLVSPDPPLTRAAAQRRIDEMSPTQWLSRFGRVSIGRRP